MLWEEGMGKHDRHEYRRVWYFPGNRFRSTAGHQIVGKLIVKSMFAGKLAGFVLYLLTPESSIRTGFEKNTHHRIEPGSERKGRVKIIIWLLLAITFGSIIAKLV